MKKILAMVLAMMLVLSMSVAFAEIDYDNAPEQTITLYKDYTVTGSTDDSLYPVETLKFTVTPDTANPDSEPVVTVDDLVVAGNADQEITVNIPEYDTVGVYKYTIKETPNSAQGVDYTASEEIAFTVLVTFGDEGALVATPSLSTVGTDDSGKKNTFVNTYDVGHLTITKNVTGNLASKNQYFEMTVTFTSENNVASKVTVDNTAASKNTNPSSIEISDWTEKDGKYTASKTFELKHGETIEFNNIPEGVTYEVVEAAKHGVGEDGFDVNSSSDTDYTISYDEEIGEIESDKTVAAKVTNEKKTEVATGISLDNAPYMILMALVVIAGAALIVKRASANR